MAIITLNNNSLSSVTSLPAGVGGKVLQVVTSTQNYQKSSNSTSYIDIESSSGTVWETSITPSATSSKILVHANVNYYLEANAAQNDVRVAMRMFQKIGSGAYTQRIQHTYGGIYWYSSTRADHAGQWMPFHELISPNTTDVITYKFQSKSFNSSNYSHVINYNDISTITLMEVAG